jgi:TonB family protein
MSGSNFGSRRFLRRITIPVFVLSITFAAGARPQQRDLTSAPAPPQSDNKSSESTSTHLVHVDSGSVTDNLYMSDFFGFTYLFPKGWSVQGEITKKYLMDVGRALVTRGDPTKVAVMDVAEKRTYQLLTVFEHPVGTPVAFNPGLIVMAEDVSFAPGIQKGSDYLLNMKMGIEKRHPELKILREPTEQSFGGKSFYRMDVSFETSSNITIFESFSCTILNGNALVFIFFGEKTERLQPLTDTLNTLDFKVGQNSGAARSSANSQVEGLQPDKPQSAVQILTPTNGVDFSIYLAGLMTTVKRKWYAVMPDAALGGTKGKVILLFNIDKNGDLSDGPLMESKSGTSSLDEAALAAIRVSAPFKSLPSDFKGPYIRLRFIFYYNMKPEISSQK